MRFDAFNIWGCPHVQDNHLAETCSEKLRKEQHTSKQYCGCMSDLKALASTGDHYIAFQGNSPEILKVIAHTGNKLAWMVDGFSNYYDAHKSGTAYAHSLLAKARQLFHSAIGGMPDFWILNELSWNTYFEVPSASYKQYALDLMKTLHDSHFDGAIICSPSLMVTSSDSNLGELSKYGYVAIEAYVDSAKLKENGFSHQWLHSQYEQSVRSYMSAGVPRHKLIVLEDYSTTPRGYGWGSGGLSLGDWLRVVKARNIALKKLDVAGVGSYGWSVIWNSSPGRLSTVYAAYNEGAKNLP